MMARDFSELRGSDSARRRGCAVTTLCLGFSGDGLAVSGGGEMGGANPSPGEIESQEDGMQMR